MISQKLETEILLDAIYKVYGYDFRGYSKTFSQRRINQYLAKLKLNRVLELLPVVLKNSEAFYDFVQDFSIPYTEMFRNPGVFKIIRQKLIPKLKTYPAIKVWHAGCATGEEPHSMAILLYEEGLLDKTIIYATDINHSFLVSGRRATYSYEKIQKFEQNYFLSGGQSTLEEYFSEQNGSLTLLDKINDSIIFAHHNIVCDSPFGEMNLIFFRNVMIYFDNKFQQKSIKTVCDSLCKFGFLVIGNKEYLTEDTIQDYNIIDAKHKLFVRV